ncbi:MAG: hypothetical protein IJ048_01205 [Clostridia bacterium]|nr:hypothetical protein [Clostridia bacterium]
MKLTENRPLACGVLALVIAGTLFIGGGNALSAKGKAAETTFYAASESISAELKELADNAVVMNSIAANAKGANQTYVTAVADAAEALRASETIAAKADASHDLTAAVENLYSNVSNLTLSDKDAEDFKYRYRNYESALLHISHDGYNDEARAFNMEKGGFPAWLISAVRGIKNLDLFD